MTTTGTRPVDGDLDADESTARNNLTTYLDSLEAVESVAALAAEDLAATDCERARFWVATAQVHATCARRLPRPPGWPTRPTDDRHHLLHSMRSTPHRGDLSRDSRPYGSHDIDRLPSYLRRPASMTGRGWPFPSETPPDAA